MKESIYTIPITEVFLPKEGCPMCRLYDILEERFLEYIMGGAMMEPSVRIQTNKHGFCNEHLEKMLVRKNRLALALMLESHLKELMNVIDSIQNNKKVEKENCYICNEIKEAMKKLACNVIVRYANDNEFKNLYNEQQELCFNHFSLLSENAKNQIGKKMSVEFINQSSIIAKKTLNNKLENLQDFIKSYDYRFKDKELSESAKNSVEAVIKYLL